MSTIRDNSQEEWFVAVVSRVSWVITPPVVIGVSLALIYATTLTADYFWDGITFASDIEKVAKGRGAARLLFHQNHLVYGAVGYVLYCVDRAAGMSVRALAVLQLTNVVFGSISVALFFQIAERMMRNRYAAVVSSFVLGLSAVWWKLSTDADSYILAVLLILLCLKNLWGSRPRWYVAGLALAGAMLIHELASLFFPAAILAVVWSKDIRLRRRFACGMGVLAWSLTIGVYYACAAILHGITNPLGVVRWAVSNPSLSTPSLNPVHGILATPRKNIDAIVGHDFALFSTGTGRFASVAALAAIIAALALVFKVARTVDASVLAQSLRRPAPQLEERWKQSAPALIAWIIAYVVFLFFWEPEDPYYPLFYMPAVALLFGLAVSNYSLIAASSSRIPSARALLSGMGVLTVATLVLFNLAFFIVPNMQKDSNRLVTAALAARGMWNERTVIYFANPNEADTTFEYFNDRTEWRRFRRASLAEIGSQIDFTSKQGGSVWLNGGAMEIVDPEWLARYARGKRIRVEVPYAQAHYAELITEQ